MSETKTCSKCGEEKPLEGFARNPRGKFGRHSRCKACRRPAHRVAAERDAADRRSRGAKICSRCMEEKPLEGFSRKARSADGRRPECKACQREAGARHYAENRRAILSRTSEWNRVNRGRADEHPLAMMKACSGCGEEKPLSAFHKTTSGRYGRNARCSECRGPIRRAGYEANRRRVLAQSAAWRENNRDRKRQTDRRWHEENRHRRLAIAKEWRRSNPGKTASYTAAYRAARLRATPAWADLDAVREKYEVAAKMTEKLGVEIHVDHYYPLRGETVCGLHVEDNLQILMARANNRKSNRPPEEWEAEVAEMIKEVA